MSGEFDLSWSGLFKPDGASLRDLYGRDLCTPWQPVATLLSAHPARPGAVNRQVLVQSPPSEPWMQFIMA